MKKIIFNETGNYDHVKDIIFSSNEVIEELTIIDFGR